MLESKFIPGQELGSNRLMVVLHGLGDSWAGYLWLPAALRVPWLNYLMVNAPYPYYGGYAWYDFSGDGDSGIRRSRRELFGLLDQQREIGFSTEQTALFGFSQGCLLALDVALRYPGLFAGVIGISGYVHQPEQLAQELSRFARQQRILMTHGTEDGLIPADPVRGQIQFLSEAGIRIDWREFAKGHTIAGEEELRVIREFVLACFREQRRPAANLESQS